MTKLFAVTGRKGSGKDQVIESALWARTIERSETLYRTKFAAPMKRAIRGWLEKADFDEFTINRMIEGDMKELPCPVWSGKSTRFVLQTMGTEWGRKTISDSLWVTLWQMEARRELDREHNVVVTDLRFPNEYEAVKDLGGTVIKVVRPSLESADTHESESYDIPYDYLFINGAPSLHHAKLEAIMFLEIQVGF